MCLDRGLGKSSSVNSSFFPGIKPCFLVVAGRQKQVAGGA